MKKYIVPGLFLFSTCLFSLNAEARLITKSVEYKQGGQAMVGYLAYDNNFRGKSGG